jgi:hypothetical protein
MNRPIAEPIADTEKRLNDTRARIAEQQKILDWREEEVGAGLRQSRELLKHMESIASSRERRLRYLRWLQRQDWYRQLAGALGTL